MTDIFDEYDKANPGPIPIIKHDEVPVDDDFSELDYRPKPKAGFLMPLVVIAMVLGMVIVGSVVFLGNDDETAVDDDKIELPGDDQQGTAIPDPAVDETEPEPEEVIEDEEVADETVLLPPNYDLHEEALHEWLKKRVGDQNVILLPAEALDDFDRFFELYDLEEDNVIVYQVETADTEFVTAVLGVPFSEWSIKAVFIWRGDSWAFLREETIIRE